MNIRDILSDNTDARVSLFKIDNYSNIYKKTEKISCAVFLITRDVLYTEEQKDIVKDIRNAAKETLFAVIALLALGAYSEEGRAFHEVIFRATTLRSLLFVLVAGGALRGDLADILAREIDDVLQTLSVRTQEEKRLSAGGAESVPEYVSSERKRARVPAPFPGRQAGRVSTRREGVGEGAVATSSAGRRDAILSAIKDKGVANIKDISLSVTDCSEKTIQRELIELIKDNMVSKEGERRWSKYRVL